VKPTCASLVGKILGTDPKITPLQAQNIQDRIDLQMRLLAQQDPTAWRALSQADRVQRAAQSAADDLIADLQKQQQRVNLQIAAADRVQNFLATKAITKPGDKLNAVSQLLDFDTKGSGFTSAASWTKALQQETFGNLIDTWTASSPKFFHLFENKKGTRDVVRELFGEKTGNADAAKGAQVWREVMEDLRQRYNAAGGDVGKLEDWHYPQSHSQQRVAAAGFDRWFSDLTPLLDRQKYVNGDGTLMRPDQLKDLFGGIYDTITTDGVNKTDTTRPQGYGMQANRGGDHRAVFFKDSQSFLAYQGQYGDKSLWSVLTGHVRTMSREVGIAETLGPDPERLFGSVNHAALLEELRANPTASAKLNKSAAFNDKLFDYVTGRQQVVDPELAEKFQAFRNFMTATKLPKVIITALGDEAGMAATTFANKIPYSETFMREMATLNPADATGNRILQRNGIGLDSMLSGLNRFGQEDYSSGWTGKIASFVMHASGAERMWDARRQGLSAVLMHYLADTVQRHANFADIDRTDHGVLADKGITETDWKVWKRADPEMWGKYPMLTPKAIHAIPDAALADLGDPTDLRRHAATNLLAHTLEEAGMGAMDTGPRQKVTLSGGLPTGTWQGELVRSALLFKSFAASMMMKHWARAATMPGMGSKFGYVAPLIVYGTVIAALGNQLRNVLSGRDPENMASPQFWGSAALRGGGLGFFGDFMYDEFTEHDTSLAAALAGPMMTSAEDVWKLTGAAAIHHLKGERTDEGGNLIRFAKENIPGLNLWYTQAAMDHILWNQMQEAVSPGYLDRMEAKSEAMKGTSWYWRPEDLTAERAPDVSLHHLFDTDRGSAEMSRMAQTVGVE
jgi:hypothetical protein